VTRRMANQYAIPGTGVRHPRHTFRRPRHIAFERGMEAIGGHPERRISPPEELGRHPQYRGIENGRLHVRVLLSFCLDIVGYSVHIRRCYGNNEVRRARRLFIGPH
jgi:hypothetical protein